MKHKGGSQASDGVTTLVNQSTFDGLSKNFSNFFNSSKCGGGRKQKGGDDVFTTVSNAVKSTLTKYLGGNPFKSQPAAPLQNMASYSNTNTYKLSNRKGGAAGLNYNSIASSPTMHGNVAVRATPEPVTRLMASNSVTVSPPITKVAAFGATSDTVEPFNYAGVSGGKWGKKKAAAAKKAPKKKPAAQKKKPAAKKH